MKITFLKSHSSKRFHILKNQIKLAKKKKKKKNRLTGLKKKKPKALSSPDQALLMTVDKAHAS